ncbi:hypothetical protein LJC19_02525 [Oxalobacter sp. OttesenSCG-928-P03]|nr:hypothetical protein [Oxalobacter sp. OttesenSCG-928-P03]
MKRFISKHHADHLKRIYMKTELDRQMIMGIHNRKAAMYDIKMAMYDSLAEDDTLPEAYDLHQSGASSCHGNN